MNSLSTITLTIGIILGIAACEKETFIRDASIPNNPVLPRTVYINSYPFGDNTFPCESGASYMLFILDNCTDYVAWEMNLNFDNTSSSTPVFRNHMFGTAGSGCTGLYNSKLGNACRWESVLAANGYFISNIPTPGAIAHWRQNETGEIPYGHVAFVEAVSGNSAIISEYNWSPSCQYNERTVNAPRYIRFSRLKVEGSVVVNPNLIIQGENVTISIPLKNNYGTDFTTNIRCVIYNNDNTLKEIIEVKNAVYFTPNQTKTITFSKSSISSAPGSYKLYFESRSSSDSPWTLVHKHNASSTIAISIISPDLKITSTSAPSSASRGLPITVYSTVKNLGNSEANYSKNKYYLSQNNSYGASDLNLGYDPVSSLDPNESSNEQEVLYIPTGITSGIWYLLFKADANDEVTESNETNNLVFRTIVIN